MGAPPSAEASSLAAGIGLQHGVDHLTDDALLGFGQGFDLFELLLQLGCRAAFGGAA